MTNISEPNVGIRLRALRDQQGYSLRALAERCGLSTNAISLIERGENSPTVSSLHRLATALDVSITVFFQEEPRQKAVFTPRDMGLRSQSNGAVMESLGIGLFDQQLEPFRMMIEPGVSTRDDLITHPGEEFVHCLDGELEYFVQDSIFRLHQGDSLLFNATQPHAYHNPTSFPATILIVFQASQDRHKVQHLHF